MEKHFLYQCWGLWCEDTGWHTAFSLVKWIWFFIPISLLIVTVTLLTLFQIIGC
jgi:hypothetical protein